MDELEISGKRYISSRMAAKAHGYTSDYIGQLIRAKKITGQKVGRAWYIEADSLAAYLNGEIASPAPASMEPAPEAPEVVIESASAAVDVVVAVEEKELAEPAVEVVENKTEEALEEPPEEKEIEATKKQPLEKKEQEVRIPIVKISAIESEDEERVEEKAPRTKGLQYVADEDILLPQLRKPAVEEAFVETGIAEEEETAPARAGRPAGSILVLAVVGMLALVASATFSARLVAHIQMVGGQTASASWALE